MLDENGEKMACLPCIRGHRVSGCNHKDRQLQHVRKKGRPVTQCVHCRNLRKNRASHVKCECGDKGHKAEDCPHLLEIELTEHVCCCSHGQRCTCALKKDPSAIAEEDDGDGGESCCAPAPVATPAPAPARPRPHAMHSEPHPTVFANGHHKPVHNKNHEATHSRAQPYRVPNRPHSIHGHHSLTQQRSMDQLRVEQLAMGNSVARDDHGDLAAFQPQMTQRLHDRHAKSENVSPAPYGRQRSRTWQNQPPQPISVPAGFDMNGPTSPMFSNYGASFTPTLNTNFTSMSMGDDGHIPSAVSDAPHVDWSHYSIPMQSSMSHLGDRYMVPPTSNPNMLHAMERNPSSTGAHSEYEYSAPYAISNPGYSESNYAQSNADLSRPDLFRVDSSQSFVHTGPTSTPQNSYFPDTISNQSMPPSLEMDMAVAGSTTSLSEIDRSSSGTGSPARDGNAPPHEHGQMPTIHGFSVEQAQKMAHPATARAAAAVKTEGMNQPASPWSHDSHEEALPDFGSSDDVGLVDNFDFNQNSWGVSS